MISSDSTTTRANQTKLYTVANKQASKQTHRCWPCSEFQGRWWFVDVAARFHLEFLRRACVWWLSRHSFWRLSQHRDLQFLFVKTIRNVDIHVCHVRIYIHAWKETDHDSPHKKEISGRTEERKSYDFVHCVASDRFLVFSRSTIGRKNVPARLLLGLLECGHPNWFMKSGIWIQQELSGVIIYGVFKVKTRIEYKNDEQPPFTKFCCCTGKKRSITNE